ncbi:hypothetical protein CHELA1G11_20427 [Hyphomicrobiales bacterium]|nr:hypothetical protein CHELA1G11_20427 [Hyphomicrobiales bacterium]CAH1690160.1 hypothetical protein CHELA1G2_20740 [Hyphomicrobiales bacterium]
MALRSGKAAHVGQRRCDGLIDRSVWFDAKQFHETAIVEALGCFHTGSISSASLGNPPNGAARRISHQGNARSGMSRPRTRRTASRISVPVASQWPVNCTVSWERSRSGIASRPEKFAATIYNRYTRWAHRGVWQRIFTKVAAAGAIPDELMLDSSHVKAHRSASGGKGGSGRRRSAYRAAVERQKSLVWPILAAGSSPSR